jgi:hypothetical protein
VVKCCDFSLPAAAVHAACYMLHAAAHEFYGVADVPMEVASLAVS